jgi:hypothetical protein
MVSNPYAIRAARVSRGDDGRFRLVVDAPNGGVVLFLGEGSDGSFASEQDAIEKAAEVGILDPERERERKIENLKRFEATSPITSKYTA